MKQIIFTVRDTVADTFLLPFFNPSQQAAIRLFNDTVENPESQFFLHPEDYDLYCLGEFETDTASITIFNEPLMIAPGRDPNNAVKEA